MRVGILGGTFDPPHHGHLLVAVDALERLGLDRLVFIPAGAQPLKVGVVTATPAQRLEMTRLLAADDPRFGVDPIEIERGGLSYTVETLSALAARRPDDRLYFFVGADVLESFHKWREPNRVARLAQIVVLRRTAASDAAGRSTPAADDERWLAPDSEAARALGDAPKPVFLETRRVDISSTEVRARVRDGRSIRGFVPDAVAAYIAAHGLYR